MKPEAQRIAIAEACGWKNQGKAKGVPGLNYRWVSPNGTVWDYVPPYDKDLNAMHEAEKVLTDEQLNDYGAYLKGRDNETVSLYCPEHREIAKVAMATASQRAEAFLRTIGKWEDDK